MQAAPLQPSHPAHLQHRAGPDLPTAGTRLSRCPILSVLLPEFLLPLHVLRLCFPSHVPRHCHAEEWGRKDGRGNKRTQPRRPQLCLVSRGETASTAWHTQTSAKPAMLGDQY